MASEPETIRGERIINVAILLRNPLDSDCLAFQMESQGEFHVVGSAESLHGFVRLCERFNPKVAIIDASYPFLSGDVFAAGTELVQQNSVQRILFMDVSANRTRAQQALNVVNAGYVTRQRTFRQLTAAILDLSDGHTPLDGFDADSLLSRRATRAPSYAANSVLGRLSARELDVLQLLAEGMSVADCANHLRLSVNTVESHKARLMNKLGVKRAIQLALIAVREGLVVP
jgi:DNA-binding NarL/FixJ family response regulator